MRLGDKVYFACYRAQFINESTQKKKLNRLETMRFGWKSRWSSDIFFDSVMVANLMQ